MTNISQTCILTVLIKPIQLFDLLLGFVKEKLMKDTLKNNLLWIALLAAISAITIKIVTSCSKGFSWERFVCFLKGADPVWIMLAVLCAFGFIYFEGLGLQCTCRFFGHGFPAGKGIIFSASDIFFSAITPSATGGQPAALIFMLKYGTPAAVSAIALLLNLVMYTVAILIISAVCCIAHPGILLRMNLVPKLFIAFGVIVQTAFIALFLMCIFNEKLILKVCRWGLRLLCKMHIYKDYDAQYEKLLAMIKQYKECGALLKKETGLLIKVFLCNLAQRLSVILVSVCVFLAVGGEAKCAFKAFSVQALAVLGSNAVPIPGAVGVADFILLSGFKQIVHDPVSVELLSRGISFYATIVFCGVLLLCVLIKRKLKNGDKI